MANYNENIAVLTSKYVMSKSSPIIYVTVYEDGIWEFWGKEIIGENEIMVVTLKQIIQVDKSILEILDLASGFAATRESLNDKWHIISKN